MTKIPLPAAQTIIALGAALTLAALFGCAIKKESRSVQSYNPSPPPKESGDIGQVSEKSRMSAEDAFRKGLESIRGHIDIFDPKWQVTFRRAQSNGWFMDISRFPKPGLTDVKILIKDNGDVGVLPGL